MYYRLTPIILSETKVSLWDLASKGWNCSLLTTVTTTLDLDLTPFGTSNNGGVVMSSMTVGGIAYDLDINTPISLTFSSTYMPTYAVCVARVAALSDLSSVSTFSFTPASAGNPPSDSMSPSVPVPGLTIGAGSAFIVQSGQVVSGSNYAPLGTTDYLTPAMKAFFGRADVKSAVSATICKPFKTLVSFHNACSTLRLVRPLIKVITSSST